MQSVRAPMELPPEDFKHLVVSWSAEAARNPLLFVDKVKHVTDCFDGGSLQYAGLLLPLVAEEMRAQVAQALEGISELPCARVDVELPRRHFDASSTLGSASVERVILSPTPEFQLGQDERGLAELKVQTNDLVLISNRPMQSLDDLSRSGLLYSLAIIEAADRDSEELDMCLSVSPALRVALDVSGRAWYLTPLGSVVTANRIWSALQHIGRNVSLDCSNATCSLMHLILHGPLPQLKSSLLELYGSEMLSLSETSSLSGEITIHRSVEAYCLSSGLNPSQSAAVLNVVAAAGSSDGVKVGSSGAIRLVQGPPGTGKTSSTVCMLLVLAACRLSSLVCAPTNVAVQEIATRLLKELPKSGSPTVPGLPGRLAVRDIVLQASEDKVDIKGPLKAILLPARAKRLFVALVGWPAKKVELENFLVPTIADIFLQGKVGPETGLRYSGSVDSHEATQVSGAANGSVPAAFKAWFCGELGRLTAPLREMGEALLYDLPEEFMLSEENASCIRHVMLLLGRFQQQVDGMNDKRLLEACQEGPLELDSSDASDLGALLVSKSVIDMQVLWGSVASALKVAHVRHCVPQGRISEQGLQRLCLESASIVFCTVSSSGRALMEVKCNPKPEFDVCIIDEAGQLVEAETAIIVQRWPRLSALVLVGDPKQLPATVISPLAQKHGYGRSLFERLQLLGVRIDLLDVQYRMHPEISLFPRNAFYDGQIMNGPNVVSVSYLSHLGSGPHLSLLGPFAFIDVADHGWEEPLDKGYSNPVEASMVVAIVRELQKLQAGARQLLPSLDHGAPLSIGIISPYAGQVEMIASKLGVRVISAADRRKRGVVAAASGEILDRVGHCLVEVRSVDGFQGREMDVIIISAVRSNKKGDIGFLKDPRRLNVAITRGRHMVWVLGNARMLAEANNDWRDLVQSAHQRGFLHPAASITGLEAVVKACNLELKRQGMIAKPGHNLFKNNAWEVVFSAEFQKSILVIAPKDRPKIVDTLLMLAKGYRPARYPESSGSPEASPDYRLLIHVMKVNGRHLVWSVDVDRHTCTQVLRAWDICAMSSVISWVRRLEAALHVYSPAYLSRCAKIHRAATSSESKDSCDKIIIPFRWDVDPAFEWFKARRSETIDGSGGSGNGNSASSGAGASLALEASSVQDSLLLMKFFSLSSAVSSALCWCKEGSTLELLFKLNGEETRIVEYGRSAFIQGRSGTGKTTVIIKKLLQLEEAQCALLGSASDAHQETAASTGSPKLRQLLVTRSPKLCLAIRNSIKMTLSTQSMLVSEGKSFSENPTAGLATDLLLLDAEEEAKLHGDLPSRLVDVPDDICPLVLTYRQFESMLDNSLPVPFLASMGYVEACQVSSLPEARASSIVAPCNDVSDAEADDENPCDWEGFSDEGSDSGDDFIGAGCSDATKSGRGVSPKTGLEVDYDRFEARYWPHLNAAARRGLDASLLWTEIQSCIKGGLDALDTARGQMDEVGYVALANSRAGMHLAASQRSLLYKLFKQYEQRRRRDGEWDAADRTFYIFKCLRNTKGLPPQCTFHCVYIDEVQDLTPSQLALFKFVCARPKEGLLICGDTAQTIAKGTSFRFETIRALVYQEFLGFTAEEAHPTESSSELRRRSVCTPHVQRSAPDMFQLVENYRTHIGVVQLAHSIVEALMHFFPASVDKLKPESSNLQGMVPVFLEGPDPLPELTGSIGGGNMNAGAAGCEFGAEQAVLVRDEATKQALLEKYGEKMIVLTVHECKGLEFQAVIVYDFLSSSKLGQKWRVMYGLMKHNNMLPDTGPYAHPTFSPQLHNLLCSELKQLYVLSTRAKECVVFWESDIEVSRPIRDYWLAQSLVVSKPLSQDVYSMMRQASDPAQWSKRAHDFFNSHQFDTARFCFERAGDRHSAKRSMAAALNQKAERCQSHMQGRALYLEAVVVYEELGVQDPKMFERAANCRIKACDWRSAAMLFRDQTVPREPSKAAECFERNCSWSDAAVTWAHIPGGLDRALEACCKGKDWAFGITLIKSTDQPIPAESSMSSRGAGVVMMPGPPKSMPHSFENFVKKACRDCFRQGLTEQLQEYTALLPTASALAFFRRQGMIREELSMHLRLGDFDSAAALHLRLGEIGSAIDMFIKSGDWGKALSSLLKELQLQLLWAARGFARGSSSPPGPGPVSLVFKDRAWAYLKKLEDLHLSIASRQEQSSIGSALISGRSAHGSLTTLTTLQWLIETLKWLGMSLEPPADNSAYFDWLNKIMDVQASCMHQGHTWLAIALAPSVCHASKSRCDSLRQQIFRASNQEIHNASNDLAAIGPEAISDLIQATRQHNQVHSRTNQLYADLVQALRAVSNTGVMPSVSSRGGLHFTLAGACMEVLGCESHPDVPHKVLLHGWVPDTRLPCMSLGGPDAKVVSASLKGFFGAACRLWQDHRESIDRTFALDSCKTATYLLPSASLFLHGRGDAATCHVPMGTGDMKVRAETLQVSCRMLSQGLSACERQLSLAYAGTKMKQSMTDVQLCLQEHLYRSFVAPQLPQAFDSQLFLSTDSPVTAERRKPVIPRCSNGLYQLVAVRADPATQASLTALAEVVAAARTIPTDIAARPSMVMAGSGQPMFHSELGYESIGRICALQDILDLTCGPVWCTLQSLASSGDPPSGRMPRDAPWQAIMSSMGKKMHLLTLSQRGGGAKNDEVQLSFECTLNGIKGLLACYNYVELWKSSPASFITPTTFISLLEKHCLVAVACVTLLHAPVFPASLVLLHLTTAGSTALLSTLLRHGCILHMREYLQRCLVEVGELLAQLLSDPVQLHDWVYSSKGTTLAETREAKTELAAFSTRCLVLLFTLAINQRYGNTVSSMLLVTLRSMAGQNDVGKKQQKAMTTMMQLLPRAITDMINRLGTKRFIGNAEELIRHLHACLSRLGDGMAQLRRANTNAPRPSFLAVDIEAWRKRPDATPDGVGAQSTHAHGVGAGFEVSFSLESILPERVQSPRMHAPPESSPVVAPSHQQIDDEADSTEGEQQELAWEVRPLKLEPVVELLNRLPWVKASLEAWLMRARRASSGELSALERLQREARMALSSQLDMPWGARLYANYYQACVCPLQADAIALRHRLFECVEFLQQQDEDQEELEEQIELLQQKLKKLLDLAEPRQEVHSKQGLAWLKSEVMDPLASALTLAGQEGIQEALCAASQSHPPADLQTGGSGTKTTGPAVGSGSSKKRGHGKKHKGGRRR